MTTFSERARWCRNNSGFSQAKAAEMTGIPQTNISAYERGVNEPKLSALVSMANAYGVSLEFLTGRSDETATPDGGFIRLGNTEH